MLFTVRKFLFLNSNKLDLTLLLIPTELYENVTEFQKEAKLLLDPKDENQSIPELEVLQKCLERGATFGIDLPEISRLKLVSFF